MTKNSLSTFLTCVILVFTATLASGQTGSVKVFCEISGSVVYLDDALQGTDINVLDSVTVGSHYLKVTNDDVIIYGELIHVTAGEVTTILVKDTKEIRDKILASKYEEIQKYKEQKLDVMINTKYVTETTGTSQTKGGAVNLFPGYYAVSGRTENTSISTTFAVSDWFLVQGSKRISELQFAQITGNQGIIDQYKAIEEYSDEQYRKANIRSRVTAGIVGPAMAGLGYIILVKAIDSEPGSVGQIMGYIWGPTFLAMGTGLFVTAIFVKNNWANSAKYYGGQINLISFSEAEKQIKIYNQNLKKELGLPIDFEPTE